MNRLSILAAAAAAALTLPAAAHAARYSETGWLLYVKGSQHTTWDLPRHTTQSDCYHTTWTEEHGHDDVTFKAKHPTKAVLTTFGGAPSGFTAFGTLEFGTGTPIAGIPIDVSIDRDRQFQSGSDPGPCGGGSTLDPAPLQDCGSRKDAWLGSPVFSDGKVSISVGPDLAPLHGGGNMDGYASCPTLEPTGVSTGTLTDDVTAPFKVKRLLTLPKGERIVVDGHKTFLERRKAGTTTLTLRTEVKWQLRMLRVR